MNVSRTKICLDTSILASSNMSQREYQSHSGQRNDKNHAWCLTKIKELLGAEAGK
jgi:hypothetical protein